MESLNPQGINSRFEDCYMKKRQRSLTATPQFNEASSSSHWSSRDDSEYPTGIIVSSGPSGGSTEEEDEEDTMKRAPSSRLSYGSVSVIGRRRMMKDAVAVAKLEPYHFFAVYDGHGGSSVSNACRERLHHLLAHEVEPWTRGGKGVLDWEKVMANCFTKMDDEVGGGPTPGHTEENYVNTVGSSAVVVMVGQNEVVVANSGNSRAVMCRDGVAIALSRDHNPDRPDERERVEAAGGRVIDWNGCRVLGVLATSRSIGDHYLKPYVISEPEVTISERTKSSSERRGGGDDDFLVIASDGLWDVVSNDCACQAVRRCLDEQTKSLMMSRSSAASNAAALLAQLALARGSNDNITVIVVELNKSTIA